MAQPRLYDNFAQPSSEQRVFGAGIVSSESESSDGGPPSAGADLSHDALGDTQLGRSLKALIKEIGREKEALRQGFAATPAPGAEAQDDDFDPSQTRFDRALEQAAFAARDPGSNGAASPGDQSPAAAAGNASGHGDAGGAPTDSEISQAMASIAQVLQRFADAERQRCEEQIAEWKVQLKKATMIVIKKQVDTARAKWMQNLSANEARIAEHYRRLKVLADKVAKQKAQIQAAKKELQQKLEVADRLHNEFDEIRHVLDGQIGAIDALEDNDEESDEASEA